VNPVLAPDAAPPGPGHALEILAGTDLFAPDRGNQARMALIAAGIHEFGEFGPEGASTRRIAQRAGQNISAISYYFQSKQGLYLAATRYIVETLSRRASPQLDEIEAFLAAGHPAPARCLAYLQQMLLRLVHGSGELVAFSQMIVREQTHPTEAFEILFKGWLERPHRLGARLIAGYVGGDPQDREFIVRYHMLLGSVLGLRTARQTLLRRLGVDDLLAEDMAEVAEVTAEHVELVLKGLRRRRQRTES
jgi:AcrR family transcriptional regulator